MICFQPYKVLRPASSLLPRQRRPTPQCKRTPKSSCRASAPSSSLLPARSSRPLRRHSSAADRAGHGVQDVPEAQGAAPEGPVVAGGGREAPRLHPPLRPRLLERAPRQGRAAAQRQELQAAVDQLPEAGAEARHVLPGGGGDRHDPPRQDGQQVVSDRAAPAGPDRQRGEELLELVPQEARRGRRAGQVRGGPGDARRFVRRPRREPQPQRQRPGRRQPPRELRVVGAGGVVVGRRLELLHRHRTRGRGRRGAAARARAPQSHVRGLARHGLRHQPGGAGSGRRRLRRERAQPEPPGVRAGRRAVRRGGLPARARRRRHLLGIRRRGGGSDGRGGSRVLRFALHERVPWDQLGVKSVLSNGSSRSIL